MKPATGREDRQHPSKEMVAAGLALGTAGAALYLWAALRAPVVLWSDSRVDLALAREPFGFLGGAAFIDHGGWGHAIKPGFIFFLTLCSWLFSDPARASVVAQSVILFAAITTAAVAIARRRSALLGGVFFVLAIGTLSFRDAASAVMSEALAAAGFLAAAAFAALGRCDSRRRAFAAGIAVAGLFTVRPNVGAAAAVLFLVAFAPAIRLRPALAIAMLGAFILVWVPVAIGRKVHGPPVRSGVTSALLTGSLDYLWPPLITPWPSGATPAATARAELVLAAHRWREMWPPSTPEIRRQWAWRMFHALLGGDYYDARWSKTYRAFDELSRTARPILVLLSAAIVLCALRDRETRRWAWLGASVIALLVAQSLLVGSLPRYGLPFLAPLLFFAVLCAGRRVILPALVFALFVVSISRFPGILDREWGKIERSGVVVTQTLPRGKIVAVPLLHVRIGSLIGPTTAGLSVVDDRGRELFSSLRNAHPEQPEIAFLLPADLRERNRMESIELRFVGSGRFDETNFYVFPVIPRPWSPPATREGSDLLSPDTGIGSGGLDWW